jgi:hypothetical protein
MINAIPTIKVNDRCANGELNRRENTLQTFKFRWHWCMLSVTASCVISENCFPWMTRIWALSAWGRCCSALIKISWHWLREQVESESWSSCFNPASSVCLPPNLNESTTGTIEPVRYSQTLELRGLIECVVTQKFHLFDPGSLMIRIECTMPQFKQPDQDCESYNPLTTLQVTLQKNVGHLWVWWW